MVSLNKWTVLREDVWLIGTVVDHTFNGDNDWSLHIRPAHGYEALAINSNGVANQDGTIECEIDTGIDDGNSENARFGFFLNKTVSVFGTWVIDNWHDADRGGKTEIHPAEIVIWESGPVFGYTKRVMIMVMSDHSSVTFSKPETPPHAGDHVHALLNIAFPPVPQDDLQPIVNVVARVARSQSEYLTVQTSNPSPKTLSYVLHCDIDSGTGNNGGYYRATYDLTYDSSVLPVYSGVLKPGNQAQAFRLDQDSNTFSNTCNTFTNQHLPPMTVRTYIVNGQRLWAGLFNPNPNATEFRWGLTWSAFVDLFGQNYSSMCLIDAETYVDNGQRLWAGIWEECTDSNATYQSDNILDLVTQSAHWHMPLVRIKTYINENGVRVWFGIYRGSGVTLLPGANPVAPPPGSGMQDYTILYLGMNIQGFTQSVINEKLSMCSIETYVVGNQRFWCGLGRKKSENLALPRWVDSNTFTQQIQTAYNNGWRLTDIIISRGW